MAWLSSNARRAAVVAVIGLVAPAATWAARPAAPGTPQVVQQVLDCRKLTDGPERLACYDKAVDGMAQAEAKGDLVTVDREQRRAVHRQAFGFNLSALNVFDRGDKPENVDQITAKIASASRNLEDKWVVRLDDGANWRQTDDTEVVPDPTAGATVQIRKGLMGAYFMNLEHHQAFKVHRDN